MAELVTKSDLAAAVAVINLTLTLRLGAMLAVGFGVLATLMKLL
jgi:branched-subunit amino acid transport protein